MVGRKIEMLRKLKVANLSKYFLFCFMLNINLAYYYIIKSPIDGDRQQVIWIAQKLTSFKKNEDNFFSKKNKSRGN